MIVYDYYRIFYFAAQYKSFTKAAEMLRHNLAIGFYPEQLTIRALWQRD